MLPSIPEFDGDITLKFYVYVLYDPETEKPRYVGKTNNPRSRYQSHLTDWMNPQKYEWVQSLLARNLKPIMRVIEEAQPQNVLERENYWIAKFLSEGEDLTNSAIPGKPPAERKPRAAKPPKPELPTYTEVLEAEIEDLREQLQGAQTELYDAKVTAENYLALIVQARSDYRVRLKANIKYYVEMNEELKLRAAKAEAMLELLREDQERSA